MQQSLTDSSHIVTGLLGKQGQWIVKLASGIDTRSVTPYRPQDAKSIGREVTFQEDVNDYELLKDVMLLLSLCVENRARRYGLRGNGVSLKITYADMRAITRSMLVPETDTAVIIYKNAVKLFQRVEQRPVRLVGVSIYNLSGEEGRQYSLEDYFGDITGRKEDERSSLLDMLRERYGLDFAGHLEQIYHGETLHKTVEYMNNPGGVEPAVRCK